MVAVLSLDPTAFRLYTRSDDVGLVRGIMLTVGFLTISAGLVAVGRLDGACGCAAAAGSSDSSSA